MPYDSTYRPGVYIDPVRREMKRDNEILSAQQTQDANDGLDPENLPDFDSRFGEWANGNVDWRTGKLLSQDPQAAIDSFVKRGIPPPDFHAPPRELNFAPGDELSGIAGPGEQNNPLPKGVSVKRFLGGFPQDVVRDPGQGNLTSTEPIVPKRVPLESIQPTVQPPTAPASPLDPEEAAVPLPAERPVSAPGSTDVSAKKKDVGGAFSDFSKSLQGVKALQPPPLNPVGTPSIRSPGAISAPNVQQLAMMGSAAQANAILPLLGKLLAMGKAV